VKLLEHRRLAGAGHHRFDQFPTAINSALLATNTTTNRLRCGDRVLLNTDFQRHGFAGQFTP
jgi:hypothetical protein